MPILIDHVSYIPCCFCRCALHILWTWVLLLLSRMQARFDRLEDLVLAQSMASQASFTESLKVRSIYLHGLLLFATGIFMVCYCNGWKWLAPPATYECAKLWCLQAKANKVLNDQDLSVADRKTMLATVITPFMTMQPSTALLHCNRSIMHACASSNGSQFWMSHAKVALLQVEIEMQQEVNAIQSAKHAWALHAFSDLQGSPELEACVLAYTTIFLCCPLFCGVASN